MTTTGPVSQATTWIPEDDLLLKNSIEGGASLEALAKGAVRFSRRFTINELRDRWHSLLYEADVAIDSSARMFELELSGFPHSTRSLRVPKEVPEKRKRKSIRKQYFTMRKKFRSEFFNSNDLGFLDEPSNLHDEPRNDSLGFQEDDLNILCDVFPETGTDFEYERVSPNLEGNSNLQAMECQSPQTNHPIWETMQDISAPSMDVVDTVREPVDNDMGHDMGQSGPFLGAEEVHYTADYVNFADLTDSMLNLANEDEMPFIEEEMVKIEESDVNPTAEIVCNLEGVNSASTSEIDSGAMICVLNTEDTEIPCNDDIFLLIHPSSVFPPSTSHTINDSKEVKEQSKVETRTIQPLLGDVAKAELAITRGIEILPVNKNLSHTRVAQSSKLPEQDLKRPQLRIGDNKAMPQYAEAGLLNVTAPVINHHSVSDSEESQSEDDIPYYSDIEAMILEMDLDPPEQESFFVKQGGRFQFEESKKTVIRLEQCARACFERSLTSQGAFAILYGRHLKHYIKKTEVIIGRATDDSEVDIDLTKEGRANKISRRQALIKMDDEGTFTIKNMGKHDVIVNGTSIVNGQTHILSTSSFIEIKGMGFTFEVNQRYVRRYIDNAARRSNATASNFDWSPGQGQVS